MPSAADSLSLGESCFDPPCNFSPYWSVLLISNTRKDIPMADISAIFFILLILGIAFPALLTAGWLLFPSLVERAQLRVERTPWSTFWLGLIVIIALTIPIFILLALPFGPAKLLGWILLGLA